MANIEPKQIQWSILEIKETEFYVNETSNPTQISFGYQVGLDINVSESFVRFSIIASYADANTNEIVLKSRSHTSFGIKDINLYARKDDKGQDEIDFPDAFWTLLFSLAYSHARALQAKSAGSTIFKTFMLPIINPESEFKKLFGRHLKS
ncbi:MAG: hypothetical protein EBR30_12790 [Cytophagia bacterium]|nr:hypothetical protein [Cytophagia bacterium]